jgi:phospholipase/lecithinase/hemolysin
MTMKSTLLSIAIAAALSIAAVGAQAAQDTAADSVQIKAPSGFRFEPQEFGDYRYAYALSNGETIRFTQRVAHYYAEIDGNPKVEIFPVAYGKFVTSAGTQLNFSEQGYELAIDNYERLPMAARLPANTIVMARR